MKDRKLAEQLKSLQSKRAGGAPDAQWLMSARETILMQIRNTVGEEKRGSQWSFCGLAETFRIFSSGLSAAVIAPVAVVVLMLSANLGASALMNVAAGTLPGDTLYDAKLLAENVNLRFAGRYQKVERRMQIAARRLDEMTRLADGIDPDKDGKLARVSALFSETTSSARADLADLRVHGDAQTAVRAALLVDAETDEYQKLFQEGNMQGRPATRLALLSLDQLSVSALEMLVEKQSEASNVLPEAQLSSTVGKQIETVALHVTTEPAKQAVEEAKQLFSQGDFKAAVLKVLEATASATGAPATDSATSTPAATDSATPQH